MNKLFSIDRSNVKSAAVYAVLTIIVTFLFVMLDAVVSNGSIYGLDWSTIIDKSTMAVLGVIVMFVSLLKNFLTNQRGKFLGFLEVIPDKEK